MRHSVILTSVANRVHLVLHERNERRNHDGCSFHQKRWHLIAEGFSTASRHENKHILTSQKVLNDGLLVVLESIKTEEFLEGFMQIRLRCHVGQILGGKGVARYCIE